MATLPFLMSLEARLWFIFFAGISKTSPPVFFLLQMLYFKLSVLLMLEIWAVARVVSVLEIKGSCWTMLSS